MSVVAIISEYNPFHNGHKYQLEQSLALTGADNAIAVMSGNFLQRGIPAISNKYHRAAMASAAGIDIIFELPFVYATASARDFAFAAVSMINNLHIADYLSFGAETDDLDALYTIAGLLVNEPAEISSTIKKLLSDGLSYPAARQHAFRNYLKNDYLIDILSSPNNILATEYLASLIKTASTMKPIVIKRKDSCYHSRDIHSSICSATAIRHLLFESEQTDFPYHKLKEVVPDCVFDIIINAYRSQMPVYEDDLSEVLSYRRILDRNDLTFVDMDSELRNRMKKLNMYLRFSETALSLKTKNKTLSHINRGLLHYILQLTSQDYHVFKENGYIYYAKLLSLRREASGIVKEINKNSTITVINKTADDIKKLNPTALNMFQYDLMATDIYNRLIYDKYGNILPNDFMQSICII